MSKIKIMMVNLIILISGISLSYGEDLSQCIIQNDIGIYKKIFNGSKGIGSGVIAMAGHFGEDHDDSTCRISYSNGVWVDVKVTQHAGSDSDKWLLHELEKSFRTYNGIPGDPYAMRVIEGNTIMVYGSAGWTYRWVSGNRVIHIEYHDSQMSKPEPLEVVSAYLAKHPSTLLPITSAELRNDANKTTWIKDEMERRLWLCDKWVEQQQAGKVDVDKLLREMHDHMKVFLNYREKYYGIAATNEKKAIYEYMQSKDETAMKNKLAEYKSWWSANKDKAINL